uniref:oxidoreductase NAD-binding domain-containing protein 1 n=1 Tax=Myxine glutinosa TaxID=7769 RepID=UPI00358E3EBC
MATRSAQHGGSDEPTSRVLLKAASLPTALTYLKPVISTPTDHQESPCQRSSATVLNVWDESQTVKGVKLQVHNEEFSFKPGQWVDVTIPGVEEVTGFSMCSSPRELAEHGVLNLAIKESSHPPTLWVHSQCKPGAELNLTASGDFFYDSDSVVSPMALLLVAGGVGVNPLVSILLHCTDMWRLGNEQSPSVVHLLFSAKHTGELLFQRSLLSLMEEFPEKLYCQFYVTQQDRPIPEDLKPHVTVGRIPAATLSALGHKAERAFVCGPPDMIDFAASVLHASGLPPAFIAFEKWFLH